MADAALRRLLVRGNLSFYNNQVKGIDSPMPARGAMPPRSKHPPHRQGPGWKAYAAILVITVATGLGAGLAVGGGLPLGSLGGLWARVTGPAPLSDDPTSQLPGTNQPRQQGFSLLPRIDQPMNILLMACDVNYTVRNGKRVMGLNGNTDTMTLMRLDPGHEQIRMLSIPRDTRVPIPGHGIFKINAANPYGGPQLAAQTVSNFLNVPVDRYLIFNTRAVIQVVDAMGGINIFVPERLHYNDWSGGLHINLNKGWNHLDGQTAHDFLRFRHDELGDIGRIQRQQGFLQALMKQYMTPLNLLKTPQLLNVAKTNLDTNLSNDELFKVINWAKDLKRSDVEFSMVPGYAGDIGPVSYWIANPDGTRQVVQTFLTGQTADVAKAPGLYKVTIRDGVGDSRAAHALRHTLEAAGYGSVKLDGLSPELGQEKTTIIAQTADIAGANAIAQKLGLGKVVVAATGSIYSDFTVVMGKDWLSLPLHRL
jgi:LCP family protein required for cell wall assembly